jgi:hypothetical protein
MPIDIAGARRLLDFTDAAIATFRDIANHGDPKSHEWARRVLAKLDEEVG